MVAPTNNRRTILVCGVLLLVTCALYWPVRHYAFVDYDDGDYVFNNPTVQNGLTWWGLTWSFVDVHVVNWHPLTWLSHMLDCQLFGLNAGGHHLVNVFFHCTNCVLLFLLLHSMTGAVWRSAFAAALFAWHPLRVESVAWISERKDVLSGLFFMLTLLAYAKYVRQQKQIEGTLEQNSIKTSAARPAFYWSLIFFLLGLLSKPMLVTLPFVLLLLDLWPLRRIKIEDHLPISISIFRSGRKVLKEKIPFFALSGLFCLITFLAQKAAKVVAQPTSFLERMGNVVVAYWRYIETFFWPHDLTVLYLRREISLNLAVLAALVVLTFFAIAWIGIRRRTYLAVGWLWFFGTLVPVIGLVPVGLQSHADRYTYLPSIGLSLMFVWGGHELVGRCVAHKKARFILGLAGATLLSMMVAATRHQLTYWKNTETLMGHALAIDPNNYIAHANLGVYFSRQGRTEEALAHYQKARELDPLYQNNRPKN